MGLDPINKIENGDYRKYNWNYSNPDRDDFAIGLLGTVVAMQEVQAMKWGEAGPTGEYDYWPDGNPKMNIRISFALKDGSLRTWTFRPASKAARDGKVPSVHMDLYALTNNTKMTNLIGHTIAVTTKQPPEGFGYTRQNPRPWKVEMADSEGTFKLNEPLPEMFKIERLTAEEIARIQDAEDEQYTNEIDPKDDIPF